MKDLDEYITGHYGEDGINREKFECSECGCYFWVIDRNEFECPNCESKKKEGNK